MHLEKQYEKETGHSARCGSRKEITGSYLYWLEQKCLNLIHPEKKITPAPPLDSGNCTTCRHGNLCRFRDETMCGGRYKYLLPQPATDLRSEGELSPYNPSHNYFNSSRCCGIFNIIKDGYIACNECGVLLIDVLVEHHRLTIGKGSDKIRDNCIHGGVCTDPDNNGCGECSYFYCFPKPAPDLREAVEETLRWFEQESGGKAHDGQI